MESHKLMHHVGRITASTFVSRILGYARDMAIANYFGAHAMADAFYVAYRIPNLLRRLLGEGSLVAAFVPIYTEYLHHKTEEERARFVNTVATVLTITLVGITIVGMIFARDVVTIIAPGFSASPQKFEIAVMLTRIMFPFFVVIGLAALFMGILNAHHLFVYPALAPCFLSIAELAFLFFICPLMEQPIRGLAFGVVCGGMLQMLFQVPPLKKTGLKFRFHIDLKNEGFRRMFTLMIPSILAVSVDQINAFVDVICATWLEEGTVSALYYANHLMLFPLALFGVAVATVSLPVLSKSASFKDFTELTAMLNKSLRATAYYIIPSSVGLMVLAHPIIRLLFERGKFDGHATDMTAQALLFYSAGLIAYASVKILATAFYSLKDTKTPVKIAVIALILNAELIFILMGPMGIGGLALATAIASVCNALLLVYCLRKKIGRLGLRAFLTTFIKILFAALVMGAVCYVTYHAFSSSRILSVCVPLVCGVLVYGGVTYALRLEEMQYMLVMLKIRK